MILMQAIAGSRVHQLWHHYAKSGDTVGLNNEERKRLYLTNQVTLFTCLMTVGYVAIFAAGQFLLPTLISIAAVLIYMNVIRLNGKRRYKLATVMLLLNGNFQISSIAFLIGRDSGTHIFLFAAILSPFLYYSIEKIKVPLFFSGLSTFLYILLEISFYLHEPIIKLEPNISKAIYITTYLCCMLAVVTFAVYMYEENIRSENRLEVERERSEKLLLNILPETIAARLKDGETPIADSYQNVSVLFSDIVGFTAIASKLSAQEAFGLLSEIFNYFDSVIEKLGVEKVRTVGDGYYVASGVPQARKDHAQALASVALGMMEFKKCSSSPLVQNMELRIGISSGPLIAGVIGNSKFQFDLWGDTVNTASRMESQGKAGRIQISEATYELIKDDFDCESRGVIPVKGKNEMSTWFLVGHKQKAELNKGVVLSIKRQH